MRLGRLGGTVAALLLGVSLPALAATRVMILPFESPSEPAMLASLGRGTADTLMTALTQVPDFVVVDRMTLDHTLKEAALALNLACKDALTLRRQSSTGTTVRPAERW